MAGLADLAEELEPKPGDWDNDGLIAAEEVAHATDEYEWDSDDGGESDGAEVAAGRDPLNETDDKQPPTCIPPGSRNWDGGAPEDSPPPAPELEALLPDEIAGVKVSKGSMQGLPRVYGFFNFFWDALLLCSGGQPEDLAHAIGVRGVAPAFTILAVRIDGVPGAEIAPKFIAELTRGTGRTLSWPITIDGRTFTVVLEADAGGITWASYASGDVMFLMTGMSASDAGLWAGGQMNPEHIRLAVGRLPAP